MNINIDSIGDDLFNAYDDGYKSALRQLHRDIVNNKDEFDNNNPHYLNGRIDKQNLILDMIKQKLDYYEEE